MSGYPLLDISDDSESSEMQSEVEEQIVESSKSQNKKSALKTKRNVPAKKHNLRKRGAPSSDGADEEEDDIVVTVSKK